MSKQLECRCECGETAFQTNDSALFRIVCHCTICQRFNNAPYADVVIFRNRDVHRPAADKVAFDTYKPPPNVQRGKCKHCDKAAIEVFEFPLFPKLVMVPQAMFVEGDRTPAPCAHIFYATRQQDALDELPKHHKFISSQLAFAKHLMSAMLSSA